MSKTIRCPRCKRAAVRVDGVTYHDARHRYRCGACDYSYTNGKTTAGDVVTQEMRARGGP